MKEVKPNKQGKLVKDDNFFEKILRAVFRFVFCAVVLVGAGVAVLLLMLIRKAFTGKNIFSYEDFLGKGAKKERILIFNSKYRLIQGLASCVSVLMGKIRLVGLSRKPVDFDIKEDEKFMFADKPALISLYFVRDSTKITHKPLCEIEREYLEDRSLFYDFLLLLKSIPAFFYSTAGGSLNKKVNLLGVEFDNISMEEAVVTIEKTIKSPKKRFICFVNPDCLNKVFTDRQYFDILRGADSVFPDGIGINLGCKLIGEPMRENINGTDMLPFLCRLCCDNGWSMFFLGAKPGVAEKMSVLLKERHPGLNIAGFRDGYFDNAQSGEVVKEINASGAEMLLVAFGVPQQEKWIQQWRNELNVPVVMGVGGLFDFYSGNIKRAPVWLREIGGEWIYRILQEPRRMWRRYIVGNPVFLYRVIKWKKARNSVKR